MFIGLLVLFVSPQAPLTCDQHVFNSEYEVWVLYDLMEIIVWAIWNVNSAEWKETNEIQRTVQLSTIEFNYVILRGFVCSEALKISS